MLNFDFSSLYRSAIGFDRLAQLFDDAQRNDTATSYPPYNIELIAEDKYSITMAIAGFDRSEIDIESDTLKVVGRKQKDETAKNYLHRGIASRDFEHRFRLADHVKVIGASMNNGLLKIELVREVPEAYKPRRILIDGDNLQLVQTQAA